MNNRAAAIAGRSAVIEQAPFDWRDPLQLHALPREERRLVVAAARDLCTERRMPCTTFTR